MDATDYQQQLLALRPPGDALPEDPDSNLGQLLAALAEELYRVDVSAASLLDESDPRSTFYLLADWERLCGIPDSCSQFIERSLQSRRDTLVSHLLYGGSITVDYLVQRAAEIGHEITIDEFTNSVAGVFVAGGTLSGLPEIRFTIRITASVVTTYAFVSGISVAGERLGYWEPYRLECLIGRIKPAHIYVVWNFYL